MEQIQYIAEYDMRVFIGLARYLRRSSRDLWQGENRRSVGDRVCTAHSRKATASCSSVRARGGNCQDALRHRRP